jgi:choline dehydrogenase-like flavoprotein
LAIGPWWYGGTPPLVDRDVRIAIAAERAYRLLARRGDGEVRWPARLVEGSRAAWSRRSARAAWADGLPEPDLLRTIVYRGEQRPSAENRVLLGGARDRLGNPLATLRWNIDERDLANAPAVLNLLAHASETLGWGKVIGPGPQWRAAVTGGPHHMGATRMSLDPRRGVVDRDCRVHGTSNLYAAGSSVFATGGHANPTFTIVALAVRLGVHLSSRFRDGGVRG